MFSLPKNKDSHDSIHSFFRNDSIEESVNEFHLIHADGSKQKNVLFYISAPKLLWLQSTDWINSPPISNIEIVYREDQRMTPLVRRLKRMTDDLRSKRGRNWKTGKDMNQAFISQKLVCFFV